MEEEKLNKVAIILGLSFIVGMLIASYTFYSAKQLDNTLSVTGSAKQRITSDVVKWRSGFSRTVPDWNLNGGYILMKQDQEKVVKFLKDSGIDEKSITVSPVTLEQYFKYDPNAPKEYNLHQSVEVQSSDVPKITDLAKNAQALTALGVIFASESLEYYYSKLPDLRVSLLSDAIKDAKARAEKIAESSGKKVGNIKSASMGVVQVMPVNSVEISDYGTYDTGSIEKEVMVTVKALFILR